MITLSEKELSFHFVMDEIVTRRCTFKFGAMAHKSGKGR
jgi:hypothetical protein